MSNRAKTGLLWSGVLGFALAMGLQAPSAWGQAATDLVCSGCVQGTDIQDGTIGPNKLIPGSINASTIANQSIGPNKLIPGSINALTIANQSIGPNKLIPGSINTSVIGNGAVTGNKVANGAIGRQHLSLEVLDQLDNFAATTNVDCGTGGTVQGAVDDAVRGQPTTIFVTGTCIENVVVAKDDITISGNQAAAACNIGDPSLSASGTVSGTVTVTGVRARIEHMIVTGPGDGIDIIDRASVNLVCNSIASNALVGVTVFRHSNAVISNTSVRLNGDGGIQVEKNSTAEITRGTISDNLESGIEVCCGGRLDMADGSVVAGNSGTGVEVTDAASIEILDSSITGNTFAGVDVEWTSVAFIGDEDGLPGDVLISGNGGGGLGIGAMSVVGLVNTTIQNNTDFAAVRVFAGRLSLEEGTTISHPDNVPAGEFTIFVSDGSVNELAGGSAPSVTGPGGAGDVAIGMFGLSSLQLFGASVNRGAAGTAVEMHNKTIGQFDGGTTVTGGITCFGVFTELFDRTAGGIDSTIGC